MKRAEVEPPVNCKHTVTIGKDGEKGSWCVECATKVFDVESRECKDCQHFFESPRYTGCKKHLMAVIPTMNVTYKIKDGTCWSGREQNQRGKHD